MRRSKLGDVYAMKVTNGYKLYQWAYNIPRWGKYIRVFEGLYQTIPDNITEIVQGHHEYIIGFETSRAYRIGLADFIENVPVPNEYPFPQYRISFRKHQLDNDFRVTIRPTVAHPTLKSGEIFSFDIPGVKELPIEYQNVNFMDCDISPSWLMFLFDFDFTFEDLRGFYPELVLGDKKDEILAKYQERVDRLLEDDRARRITNR